jgi:hypothetical protein
MRLLPLLLIAAACSTTAEDLDPADEGNLVYSLHGDSFEMSGPGEYSSASGEPGQPLLVLAHAGGGAALRSHQSGSGSAAVLVADGTRGETAALDVTSRGTGPAARFAGGRVAIGARGTVVLESIARAPAADRIAPTDPASVVVIVATEGVQQNAVAVPQPVEGQLLWVVNEDDDPARVDGVTIPAGESRQLVHVGGRFR